MVCDGVTGWIYLSEVRGCRGLVWTR